jgi:hypothetical protein
MYVCCGFRRIAWVSPFLSVCSTLSQTEEPLLPFSMFVKEGTSPVSGTMEPCNFSIEPAIIAWPRHSRNKKQGPLYHC